MFDCTCLDKYGNTITALYQWDTNQTLYIEDHGFTTAPFFHFCNQNSDRAYLVSSSIDVNGVMTVKIPNVLLSQPYPITAYVYLIEDDAGSTVEVITIPVRPRPMPEDSEYATDEEITTIVDLEARVNATIGAMNIALADAISAETIRVNNENERIQNEMTRVYNENVRKENEVKRANAIAEAQTATERANLAAEACEEIVAGTGFISSTEKGVANGVATLNQDGAIPSTQIATMTTDEVDTLFNDIFGL